MINTAELYDIFFNELQKFLCDMINGGSLDFNFVSLEILIGFLNFFTLDLDFFFFFFDFFFLFFVILMYNYIRLYYDHFHHWYHYN